MSKNHYSKIIGMLFLAFFLFSFVPKHAIHLSITEMDFRIKGEKTEIQIAHKIFVDDLEKALIKNYPTIFENAKPNISTKTQHKEAEKYIYEYLKKVVELKIDSKKETINYIGVEFEDDVVWIYGMVEKTTKATEKESIFIKNMILMDLFDDQRNMLYLTKENLNKEKTKEFLNFTVDNRSETIDF